jgi:hypothetical protein
LENLNDGVDINRAWETIREDITISAKDSLGYYELNQPWFDEWCYRTVRSKETSQIAMTTGSKPNKWE